MKTFDTILYETPADHVARIVLNRPETRNAQDTRLLYELNEAFDVAAQDDQVKVIILAAKGPHFSAGHDLRERDTYQHMSEHKTVGTWCGFTCAGGGSADGAREGDLHRLQRALAQYPEAHHRRRAGPVRRGRAHADLAVRHHHRR